MHMKEDMRTGLRWARTAGAPRSIKVNNVLVDLIVPDFSFFCRGHFL